MAEMFQAISDDFWDALSPAQTINMLLLATFWNHGNAYKYTQITKFRSIGHVHLSNDDNAGKN